MSSFAEPTCAETCLDSVSEALVDVLAWLSENAAYLLDCIAQVRGPPRAWEACCGLNACLLGLPVGQRAEVRLVAETMRGHPAKRAPT